MADVEEGVKRPLESEDAGVDDTPESAVKRKKLSDDVAPAVAETAEETKGTRAGRKEADAEKKAEPAGEEEKKPVVDGERTEESASAPKSTGFGGLRFGAVSSAPKGGFGAAAAAAKTTSGFGSGFGAASSGGGSNIWAKAAAQFGKPTGFGAAAAAKKPEEAAPEAESKDKESEESEGEDEENNESGVEASASFNETKELIPGLSAGYDYKTGEEDEDVVYHCRAKLHHLNLTNKTWISLGEGTINLNVKKEKDASGHRQARLVLRCLGSMKLLLNVRIWDGMAIEMVGLKQIRFLSVETNNDGSPKVCTYLITTSRQDCGVLYDKIKSYVKVVTAANNGTTEETEGAASAAPVAVTFTRAQSNLQDIARESMASTT